MGRHILIMFRALVLTLCVLSAAGTESFDDAFNPEMTMLEEDTILPEITELEMNTEPEPEPDRKQQPALFSFDDLGDQLLAMKAGSASGSSEEDSGSGDDSGSGECEDYTQDDGSEWHDADGSYFDCEWYSEGSNCARYGDGYEYADEDANQACCACGGGTTGTGDDSGSGDTDEILAEFPTKTVEQKPASVLVQAAVFGA